MTANGSSSAAFAERAVVDPHALEARVAALREPNPLSLEHALRSVCTTVDAVRRELAAESAASLAAVMPELSTVARFFACATLDLLVERAPVRGGLVVCGCVAEDEADARLALEVFAVTDSVDPAECQKLERLLDKLQAIGGRIEPAVDVRVALKPAVIALGEPDILLATWSTRERLLLSSARFLWGPAAIAEPFVDLVRGFVPPPRLPSATLYDLAQLREAIEEMRRATGSPSPEAASLELELLARSLRVLHGGRHPELLGPGVAATLAAAARVGLCDPADRLPDAYRAFRQAIHDRFLARLSGGDGRAARESAPPATERLAADEARLRAALARYLPMPKGRPRRRGQRAAAAAIDRQLALLGAAPGESGRAQRAFHALRPTLERLLARCVAPQDVAPRFAEFAERYGAKATLYEALGASPRALELLVRVFDESRFFSDLLLGHVTLFDDCQDPASWQRKTVADHLAALRAADDAPPDRCRRYRNAEVFRVFVRDVLGIATLDDTCADYSALAEACVRFAVESTAPREPLVVIALGKLGGGELCYGSDLDCVIVGEDPAQAQRIIHFLTEVRPTGTLFPVDLRLRPDGAKGEVTLGLPGYRDYYRSRAQSWEIQALTRARPVAGDDALAAAFMRATDEVWRAHCETPGAIDAVDDMRRRVEAELGSASLAGPELKTGAGGLLDVEFGLQAWLLARRIREPSTSRALDHLGEERPELARAWREGYGFLRRIESVLRRDGNASTSRLPARDEERSALARRLGSTPDGFATTYEACRRDIRAGYEQLFRSLRTDAERRMI